MESYYRKQQRSLDILRRRCMELSSEARARITNDGMSQKRAIAYAWRKMQTAMTHSAAFETAETDADYAACNDVINSAIAELEHAFCIPEDR